MSVATDATQEFVRRFGDRPSGVVRAPGRVNLIGEHTDYNDGFVLPMAIDREVCIAFRPRPDDRVIVHSLEYDETEEFELGQIVRNEYRWIEYVKGVAWSLHQHGEAPRGWEGVIHGDVPIGAGLSSSAALELAVLRVFNAVGHVEWVPAEAALLAQHTENKWIGLSSGIMDPMVIGSARENHAILLDCRTLAMQHVALPAGIAVVVLDTATRRGLVDSAYDERQRQCQDVAHFFAVDALRDLSLDVLEAGKHGLDEFAYRRARHVITENQRTLAAADALRAGDPRELGSLMNASHASLRDDFQVSTPALDCIVRIAQNAHGCFGARLTGAGFGGCAVAIVAGTATEEIIQSVTRGYQSKTGWEPRVYKCHAARAVGLTTGD